ncbi:MAG: peptide ABC transporter permease [Calditrichaeota bacterium]|nr:MAG: peptide ABC transporter permease [Calditrichota bacterium]
MKKIYQNIEAFKIALQALIANKTRGILTTLGIIIGIVAVITTMTAANGLGNAFKESIASIGSDVLYVSRFPWIIQGDFFQYRNRDKLELKDARSLRTKLPDAIAVNPSTSTTRHIKYGSNIIENNRIIGTTDKLVIVSDMVPESGRFLTGADVQYKKNVCVIGSEVKNRLFGQVNPLNKKMKIGMYNYRVIGVMEKQGTGMSFGGPNFDMRVYIPITSLLKNYGSRDRNFDIAIKAPSQDELENFEYAVIGEMRKIRGLRPTEKDDFSINKMDSLLAAYNNVMGVVVLIGLAITSVSLVVGGIGVMNIMFVSVTERTREIGIRKAIGATRRAILTQFLFEASAICVLGGLIGLSISYGITSIINDKVMPASISPFIIIVALVVSILTGLISGLIPAIKASRLNPIESLRYE